jgi:mono/diheme cytochrome c family protein
VRPEKHLLFAPVSLVPLIGLPHRLSATLLALAAALTAARAAAPVNFGREILPILSNHCFHCHGPDDRERKGGLRLDTAEGVRAAGKSGAVAVVPGRSAESELFLRISSPHDDEVMPPAKAKKTLTPAQIDLLKRWIDEGAPWGRHWSFEPPQRPPLPPVPAAAAGHSAPATPLAHPIDRFIRARLAREGLAPSPEADRRTLFRRLSFDLVGLPPEPAAVQAFVADTRPDAYERAVDALLASPHFGERWGRHWLDLARYADSAGYLNDTLRPYAYLYRDWVIASVNRDQPFDQFTIEQLAGDLLPDATLEQRIATGFHRNSLKNDEAGADLELDRTKAAVDRAATTGAVWLGLTVGCAECHTHKYDPITHPRILPALRVLQQHRRARPARAAARRTRRLPSARRPGNKERQKPRVAARGLRRHPRRHPVPEWESTLKVPAARWTVLAPEEITIVTEDEERIFPPNDDHSITTGAARSRCAPATSSRRR